MKQKTSAVVFAMATLLSANVALSRDLGNCPGIRPFDRQVDRFAQSLVGEYPGTLAVYAGCGIAIDASDLRNADEIALAVGGCFVTCAIVIDTASCEHVGKSLVGPVAARAAIRDAARTYSCGLS